MYFLSHKKIMKKIYIKIPNGFSDVDGRTYIGFIPAESTLNVRPPYIKGKLDYGWKNINNIDLTNKDDCERAVSCNGLIPPFSLLPIN
jgi:hypothetical protein